MKKNKVAVLLAAASPVYADNNIDALIPDLWAMESLIQLEKLSVMPWLVHRDFDGLIANYGETVNAHLPADFKLTRKGVNDSVETQDASISTVPVKLDQHIVVSFVIKDGEESKAFKSLIATHLEPAMRTISEGLDKILASQVYNYLGNTVGKLGVDATARSLADLKALNTNNRVPTSGRNNVLSADTEADLTSLDLFIGADKVGDDGTALREGSLGRKYGANNITDIAIPSLVGGTAGLTKTVNLVAGYPAGYTGAIVLDTGVAHEAYSVVTIDGVPYTVSAGSLVSVTLDQPLKAPLADGAEVKQMADGTIGAEYPLGHVKGVLITGIRGSVGEAIRTAAGDIYTIVEATGVADTYLLDRPLDGALTASQKVGVFPDGDYNFSFHRNALALVTRPLALPRLGTGALAAVQSENGVGVRVVITYDGVAQGHRVTIDLLAGVKVLNEDLGAVLLS
ncbi:hypothetical protein KAU11_08065 [Candidatus Babeliales bacterium]|nr:hypothetical protein [Candidatus Babeliales bacterium]